VATATGTDQVDEIVVRLPWARLATDADSPACPHAAYWMEDGHIAAPVTSITV
jgi:hypothetical protein